MISDDTESGANLAVAVGLPRLPLPNPPSKQCKTQSMLLLLSDSPRLSDRFVCLHLLYHVQEYHLADQRSISRA